jgi:N-acetylglucosamine-6-phosphate deacetylase
MSSLCITGAEIVTPLEVFKGSVYLDGDRISRLSRDAAGERLGRHARSPSTKNKHTTVATRSTATRNDLTTVIDGSGCYLTPGLIDLQVNGDDFCNLWDKPTTEQFEHLRKHLLSAGITSFLPTLITDELTHLAKNLDFLARNGVSASHAALMNKSSRLRLKRPTRTSSVSLMSRVPGIHLEGPFLSHQRAGVHPQQWIRPISLPAIKKLLIPEVLLVTLAPELPHATQAIKYLHQNKVVVSLGHSNANLEQAQRAFRAGVSLMTHTYNALPAFHHRAPGAVAAAMLNPAVSCTVIADGLHVHPAAIELLLKCTSTARTILVSDAATEGTKHGGLAGSSITVADAVTNIVNWTLASFADAIMMASYNPAAAIGLEGEIGQIAPGKKADLLLWDKKSLKLKSVIFNGELV